MKIVPLTVMLTLMMLISSSFSEKAEKKVFQGSVCVSSRYQNLQIADAQATLYKPSSFEGMETISFDQGNGVGSAGGILREGKLFFGGLELELFFHNASLTEELHSEIFKEVNSCEQGPRWTTLDIEVEDSE